jgi:hypothetical protein
MEGQLGGVCNGGQVGQRAGVMGESGNWRCGDKQSARRVRDGERNERGAIVGGH